MHCKKVLWQCDQMGIILVKYLAMPNFENLTNGIKICQHRFKTFPNTKLIL